MGVTGNKVAKMCGWYFISLSADEGYMVRLEMEPVKRLYNLQLDSPTPSTPTAGIFCPDTTHL